jgi:hypothetical protein
MSASSSGDSDGNPSAVRITEWQTVTQVRVVRAASDPRSWTTPRADSRKNFIWFCQKRCARFGRAPHVDSSYSAGTAPTPDLACTGRRQMSSAGRIRQMQLSRRARSVSYTNKESRTTSLLAAPAEPFGGWDGSTTNRFSDDKRPLT